MLLAIWALGILMVMSAALAAWVWVRWRLAEGELARARADRDRLESTEREAEARAAAIGTELADLRVVEARLREERGSADALFAERERSLVREREVLERRLEELRGQMGATFEALAGKTLQAAGDELLKRAKAQFEVQQKEDAAELEKRRVAVEQLVKPIGDTLQATREKLEEIERDRVAHFAKIGERVEGVERASLGLREETARLAKALSRPEVRGRYGEIQLRRVAELAGMAGYCDFDEQVSQRDGEGNLRRPDMVVRLPNERVIAVDAKTNTSAYLDAANAGDAGEREAHLERFARHVADQARKLGEKRYWSAWDGSPDFVVMFVPGDQFIDAALARRMELLDEAAQMGVILASPSTLIGLLRAVAVGWREQRLTDQARDLFALGRELHERAAVAFEHVAGVGEAIGQAAGRYNRMVGSIEGRLVPTLRKFEEAGAKSARELPAPERVEVVARPVRSLHAPGGLSGGASGGEPDGE